MTTNRYRVLLPVTVSTTKGTYGQGEEFDGAEAGPDFDEDVNVASGLLAIVPNSYRVVGGSTVDGHEPDETFTSDMSLSREALLVAGGHIERITEESAPAEAAPDVEEEPAEPEPAPAETEPEE